MAKCIDCKNYSMFSGLCAHVDRGVIRDMLEDLASLAKDDFPENFPDAPREKPTCADCRYYSLLRGTCEHTSGVREHYDTCVTNKFMHIEKSD